MPVANDFSQRFSGGENILRIDEAEQFIENMDTRSFWDGQKRHPHHNNYFYEFVPLVRVCRTLHDPNCKIKFAGITNKPFDAEIYSNGVEMYVECTCAIHHYENTIKQELHDKYKYEIAAQWSNSYEDPVTYGEIGGRFNSAAPIKWSGNKRNRRLTRHIEGFYPKAVAELNLLSMVAKATVEKAINYSWDGCTFTPNWLIIVFDNANCFDRNFLIEVLALIDSRAPGFERLYLVSICDSSIISSHDREVRELVFKSSGGRRWIPITRDDPR